MYALLMRTLFPILQRLPITDCVTYVCSPISEFSPTTTSTSKTLSLKQTGVMAEYV